MVANCEPAEEWLDIDEEDEGGEPVSLDDAPADRNGICDAARGGVDYNLGAVVGIDALDDSNGIRWETKVSHDFEKLYVVDGVEGIGEVDIEEIYVSVKE